MQLASGFRPLIKLNVGDGIQSWYYEELAARWRSVRDDQAKLILMYGIKLKNVELLGNFIVFGFLGIWSQWVLFYCSSRLIFYFWRDLLVNCSLSSKFSSYIRVKIYWITSSFRIFFSLFHSNNISFISFITFFPHFHSLHPLWSLTPAVRVFSSLNSNVVLFMLPTTFPILFLFTHTKLLMSLILYMKQGMTRS